MEFERALRAAQELSGIDEGDIIAARGRQALNWRRVVIRYLSEVGYSKDELKDLFSVTETTITTSIEKASPRLLGKLKAQLAQPQQENKTGIATALETLNSLKWMLNDLKQLSSELLIVVGSLEKRYLELLTGGNPYLTYLTRLIAAGWGDTPQPKIPNYVKSAAQNPLTPVPIKKAPPQTSTAHSSSAPHTSPRSPEPPSIPPPSPPQSPPPPSPPEPPQHDHLPHAQPPHNHHQPPADTPPQTLCRQTPHTAPPPSKKPPQLHPPKTPSAKNTPPADPQAPA